MKSYRRMGGKNAARRGMNIPIAAPGCIPADCAVVNGEGLLSSNAFTNEILGASGQESIMAARPYRFLSSLPCGGFLALSGKCESRIYVLNQCFEETGSITPGTLDETPQSAFMYPDGSGILITGAKEAVKISTEGRTLEVVGTASDGTRLLSCFPLSCGFLVATEENEQTVIRLTGGSEEGYVIPKGLRFKSFCDGNDGTVYALIGKGYPYTYLVPVYDGGSLKPVSTNAPTLC